MSFQNRVDPWGALNAVSARGAWLGNRGILHNEHQQIVVQWRGKAWITCLLDFKNRANTVFAADAYTQLFFLDEASAFAAGHRPCAECRRERFNQFKSAWIQANRILVSSEKPTMPEIDKLLHAERVMQDTKGKRKRTFAASLGDLPDGSFFHFEGNALLIWRANLWRWSFDGYTQIDAPLSSATLVDVLTPESIVRLFASGFVPQVHASTCG